MQKNNLLLGCSSAFIHEGEFEWEAEVAVNLQSKPKRSSFPLIYSVGGWQIETPIRWFEKWNTMRR